MSVAEVKAPVQNIELYVKHAQEIVVESLKEVVHKIGTFWLIGKQKGCDAKQLAEGAIRQQNLDQEIADLDERVKKAYKKLFAASEEHCKSAPIMNYVLHQVQEAIGNEDAPRKFLGSFVLPETKVMVDKLDKEIPGALDDDVNINWGD